MMSPQDNNSSTGRSASGTAKALKSYCCHVGGEWKPLNAFSKAQQKKLAGKTVNPAKSGMTCREHNGEPALELKCSGPCGMTLPLNSFSLANRTKGVIVCIACQTWINSQDVDQIPYAPPNHELDVQESAEAVAQPVQPEAYLEHAIDSLLLHEADEDERPFAPVTGYNLGGPSPEPVSSRAVSSAEHPKNSSLSRCVTSGRTLNGPHDASNVPPHLRSRPAAVQASNTSVRSSRSKWPKRSEMRIKKTKRGAEQLFGSHPDDGEYSDSGEPFANRDATPHVAINDCVTTRDGAHQMRYDVFDEENESSDDDENLISLSRSKASVSGSDKPNVTWMAHHPAIRKGPAADEMSAISAGTFYKPTRQRSPEKPSTNPDNAHPSGFVPPHLRGRQSSTRASGNGTSYRGGSSRASIDTRSETDSISTATTFRAARHSHEEAWPRQQGKENRPIQHFNAWDQDGKPHHMTKAASSVGSACTTDLEGPDWLPIKRKGLPTATHGGYSAGTGRLPVLSEAGSEAPVRQIDFDYDSLESDDET